MTWIDDEVAKQRSEKLKAERDAAIHWEKKAEIESAMQKFWDLLLKQNERLPTEIRLKASKTNIGGSHFFQYGTKSDVIETINSSRRKRFWGHDDIHIIIKYSLSKKTYFAIRAIGFNYDFFLIRDVESFIDRLLQMECTGRPVYEALDDQSPVKTCYQKPPPGPGGMEL